MLDVIFAQNGTATDQSTSRWPLISHNPSVAWNSTYGRYEAIFNNATNADSYFYLIYSVYETFREKMKDGFTYECLVKIDPTITHEQKFFGGLQDGGGCLGFSGGKFFASFFINGAYRVARCTSAINANQYYHVVGVWDKPNGKVLVYLNGVLEGTATNAFGEFRFPQASDYTLAIGADQAGSATSYENNTAFVGRFVIGRVYDKILTANEISKLYCSVKK
jgi:hypothetical protein